MIAVQDTEESLWEAYCAEPSVENRNLIAEHYFEASRRVVNYLKKKYSPEFHDLVESGGNIGLIEAVETYDGKSASFMTYLWSRIRTNVCEDFRNFVGTRRKVVVELKPFFGNEEALVQKNNSPVDNAIVLEVPFLVGRLSPKKKALLGLKYGLPDMCCDDISRVSGSGLTGSGVRRAHIRIKKQLAEMLD